MKLIVYALVFAVLLLAVGVGIEFGSISSTRVHGRAQTCLAIKAIDTGIINIVTPSKKDLAKLTKAQRERTNAFVARAKATFVPPVYCK